MLQLTDDQKIERFIAQNIAEFGLDVAAWVEHAQHHVAGNPDAIAILENAVNHLFAIATK